MNMSPPVEIAAWLACLTFVVMLFNNLSRAWFTLQGKPTPIEQQQATNSIAERVSRMEMCQVDQARRLEALETDADKMRDLVRTETDKVFIRVNAVADVVSTSSGQLSFIRAQLTSLLERNR